jgi:hypothetical protein
MPPFSFGRDFLHAVVPNTAKLKRVRNRFHNLCAAILFDLVFDMAAMYRIMYVNGRSAASGTITALTE